MTFVDRHPTIKK